MATQGNSYKFEMFDLRQDLLDLVAENARKNDLKSAKRAGKREIEIRAKDNARQNALAFTTSFDKARKLIREGGNFELDIEDMPPILEDHDAEIDPNNEIDGKTVGVVRSHDHSGVGEPETSTYPVVRHENSGFRVCTCAAQKFYIVCPHTLARVIERNWPNAPTPS